MQSLKLFVLIPFPINQTDKIVGEEERRKEKESLENKKGEVPAEDAYTRFNLAF